MSAVMKIVKDEGLDVLEQDFTESCRLALNVRLSDYIKIHEKYQNIYGITIK